MSSRRRGHETLQRVEFLKRGPWAMLGETAWKEIAWKKAIPPMARSEGLLNLAAVYGKANAPEQRRLRQLLRNHRERATSDEEDISRNSFDDALTRYQLYELAVESSYIPLTAIWKEARNDLVRLLWSEAARRYLRHYHYVTVAFLAGRLGLEIGFPCKPPPVQEGNQTQFAFFLSQHQTWYNDVLLDGWLAFLDDYEVLNSKRSDKEILQDFLNSDTDAFDDEFVLWQLVAGAERFLFILSDLYTTLSRSERPSYGSFYFYWMARFYGYRSAARGFERDKNESDWSRLLLGSKRLKSYAQSTLSTKRANRRYCDLRNIRVLLRRGSQPGSG